MSELKDFLNAINLTGEDLLTGNAENIKKYPPFVVNRCVASFADSVLFVNEINMRSHLDKEMQFQFLLNTIRKRKRFAPWLKAEKLDGLEAIKKYYAVGDAKAKKILELLDEEEIGRIKDLTYPKGGNNNERHSD